jgi:hypothetical protein
MLTIYANYALPISSPSSTSPPPTFQPSHLPTTSLNAIIISIKQNGIETIVSGFFLFLQAKVGKNLTILTIYVDKCLPKKILPTKNWG